MKAYLDASALLPMLIAEPGSVVVDAFMASLAGEPLVSEFAAAEVTSAISRLVRTERLKADDARARLADFDAWRATATQDVELNAADIRLAHLYVRRFELMLRAPDALHAAICRRADLDLITLDRRLVLAAKSLGVSVQLLEP